MRGEYYEIVGKYGIPRFQLFVESYFVLLLPRNTMDYSRKPPTMQCSKKRPLVVFVPFSTDQYVFCDLQEFHQISFLTLKLTSTHAI